MIQDASLRKMAILSLQLSSFGSVHFDEQDDGAEVSGSTPD